MGTTTYSKDDWDNGATTNSKVTRTMGNSEQWDTVTYSKRLNQLHCLQVHQIRSHDQNSITTVIVRVQVPPQYISLSPAVDLTQAAGVLVKMTYLFTAMLSKPVPTLTAIAVNI